MDITRERFTLSSRTNKSGKFKVFKPNSVSKQSYKVWKANANVMLRDVILANKVGLSYPRQLELIHGTIERILKTLIIQRYGLEVPIHETKVIYDALKADLCSELTIDEYNTLKLLDSKFLLDRYPNFERYYDYDMIEEGISVLLSINAIITDSLNLSNRAKKSIGLLEEDLYVAIDKIVDTEE